MIGDGVDHCGHIRVNALLRLKQFLGHIRRTRGWHLRRWFWGRFLGRLLGQPGLCGACDKTGHFREGETNIPSPSFATAFGGRFFKDPSHFFGESIAMAAWIQQ
jgi:hypothetical protein